MSIQQDESSLNNILAAYQAVNQHWSHAEQERWSILYNFLTANTILLLAWATIYSSQRPAKEQILLVLSLSGLVISFLWLIIESRVNTFIKRYGKLGEKVEDQLHLQVLGPFHAGETIRRQELTDSDKEYNQLSPLERIGTFMPTRIFVLVVPVFFAFIYSVLVMLS